MILLSQEIKAFAKEVFVIGDSVQSKSDGCYKKVFETANDDLGKKGELLWRLMEEQDFLPDRFTGRHSGSPQCIITVSGKTEQDYVYLAFEWTDKTEEAVTKVLKALGCKGL